MIVLAVISAVDAGLWACAAGSPWWLSLLSILLAVLGAVVVFLLAVYASDPAQPLLRWVALVLFLLSVLAAYAMNRYAVDRYRRGR